MPAAAKAKEARSRHFRSKNASAVRCAAECQTVRRERINGPFMSVFVGTFSEYLGPAHIRLVHVLSQEVSEIVPVLRQA